MPKTLIFIQTDEGQATRNSLEAVAAAHLYRADNPTTLTGVVFGTDTAPKAVANIDLDEIILVPNSELANYTPEYFLAAMETVIASEQPDLILAGFTYQARDWFPRLSSRIGRPLVSDCIGFEDDGEFRWIRQVFQGKMNARIKVADGLTIVAFQSGSYRSDQLGTGSPAVRTIEIDLSSVQVHVRPGEKFQDSKGTVDLSRAERILSVGRGIGEETNLPQMEALAKALGAELAASRPVVDYGWLDHNRQVGSSGQTVMPKLYFALGISGAIQHQVGMKNAGCIVAVNKDANAPIFEIADYGIVADLFDIVPPLTAALEKRT